MKQNQYIGFAGLAGAILWGAFSYDRAAAQATIDLAGFRSSTLSEHNKYRAVHHAPGMTLSNVLNSSAQRWAGTIASRGSMEHSGPGENIYVDTRSSLDGRTLGTIAVKDWYDEVSKYDYANPGFSGRTGHFTQVVWKGSTQLGCGAAQGTVTIGATKYNKAFYVVCQYSPLGNVQGAFPGNVQKP